MKAERRRGHLSLPPSHIQDTHLLLWQKWRGFLSALPMHPLLLCMLEPKPSVILAQLSPSQWNCPVQGLAAEDAAISVILRLSGMLNAERSIVLVITLGLGEMILQLWNWQEVSFGEGMNCFLEISPSCFVFTSEVEIQVAGSEPNPLVKFSCHKSIWIYVLQFCFSNFFFSPDRS